MVAQFCNPATGGLDLRDGWRRPGLTDLEEGQFQDRIMPSQQALRRAIRETMDMLAGNNFPVMCNCAWGNRRRPEFEPGPCRTVADLPIPSDPVLFNVLL